MGCVESNWRDSVKDRVVVAKFCSCGNEPSITSTDS